MTKLEKLKKELESTKQKIQLLQLKEAMIELMLIEDDEESIPKSPKEAFEKLKDLMAEHCEDEDCKVHSNASKFFIAQYYNPFTGDKGEIKVDGKQFEGMSDSEIKASLEKLVREKIGIPAEEESEEIEEEESEEETPEENEK